MPEESDLREEADLLAGTKPLADVIALPNDGQHGNCTMESKDQSRAWDQMPWDRRSSKDHGFGSDQVFWATEKFHDGRPAGLTYLRFRDIRAQREPGTLPVILPALLPTSVGPPD